MKLKKFIAPTEQEALEKAKADLGEEALILNIRKVQPRGIRAIFIKPTVEITAAYKETINLENKNAVGFTDYEKKLLPDFNKIEAGERIIISDEVVVRKNKSEAGFDFAVNDENSYFDSYTYLEEDDEDATFLEEEKIDASNSNNEFVLQEEKIKTLEKKLLYTEDLLQKVINELSATAKEENKFTNLKTYNNPIIQLFYDAFVTQGVLPKIAEKILEDIKNLEEDETEISYVAQSVYKKITDILGKPKPINIDNAEKGNPKVIALIGPTGVGKTTTVAKLSSDFILSKALDVALVTADTYRIAAIEQLKTYAEILNIEVAVVYNNLELVDNTVRMSRMNNIIFIDTAGRSHKSDEAMDDLKELLEYVDYSEKYLVLSLATKYDDMLEIIDKYSEITDFRIIFTKFDETKFIGSILNVCYETKSEISYITTGQNVPDDIEVFSPEKIAKALLGIAGES